MKARNEQLIRLLICMCYCASKYYRLVPHCTRDCKHNKDRINESCSLLYFIVHCDQWLSFKMRYAIVRVNKHLRPEEEDMV